MATKKSTALSKKDADVIFKRVHEAAPLFTEDECERAAARFASKDEMRKMRLVLAVATKSGKFLEDLAKGDKEGGMVLAHSLVLAQEFQGSLEAMSEIAADVAARCGVALTLREDMQELIDAAEARDEVTQ